MNGGCISSTEISPDPISIETAEETSFVFLRATVIFAGDKIPWYKTDTQVEVIYHSKSGELSFLQNREKIVEGTYKADKSGSF